MKTTMAYVKSFRELDVYKLARELSHDIYITSKSFPKEEMYSLTDQIRRCSRSVGGQIAEAWAKRRYINHFISKLTDADGEKNETEHWSETALRCNYITQVKANEWLSKCATIGTKLQKMIDKADTFCGAPVVKN